MALYLYQKTHNETGLKYLGYTRRDPFKYNGSGKHWLRHIKLHGTNISTTVLKEYNDIIDLKYWGEYYSNLWNIVESKDWANLKPESGDGGNARKGKRLSKEHRQKISKAAKKRRHSENTRRKMSEKKQGSNNPRYGSTSTSDAHKKAMKKWWAERKMREET